MRIRGTERLFECSKSFSKIRSVMVWFAIAKGKVIGPYVFEDENVNGENYRNMLVHYTFHALRL